MNTNDFVHVETKMFKKKKKKSFNYEKKIEIVMVNINRVASRILPIRRNLMSHLSTWKTGTICWEFVYTRFRTIYTKESFMCSIHTSLTSIFKLNGHFYNAPPRFIWTCTQLICIVNVLYYVNWYVEWKNKNRTANIIWNETRLVLNRSPGLEFL